MSVDGSTCPTPTATAAESHLASDDSSSCDVDVGGTDSFDVEEVADATAAFPDATRESIRAAFAAAVAVGDVKSIAAALAHPLLNPQQHARSPASASGTGGPIP